MGIGVGWGATLAAWWDFLVAGAYWLRLRVCAGLARQTARLALALSRHSAHAISQAEQARRVIEVTRAAYQPRASAADTSAPLPAVIALPTFPQPASASLRDTVDVSGVWRVRTQPQPALPAASSLSSQSYATPVPSSSDRTRSRATPPRASHTPISGREATPPGSEPFPFPPAPSLGGVSAFARAMGRDADPPFPNVRALTLCLCDALRAIEQERPDLLAEVAENLACAALQIPRHVDAALFDLLPSPPLPPSADAPDAPDAPDADQPAWLVEWLLASQVESDVESEPAITPTPTPTPTEAEAEAEARTPSDDAGETGAA